MVLSVCLGGEHEYPHHLVVGLLGFVVPTLFGLLPDGYTIFDNLLHLAFGVASIAVALFGQGRVAARG